MKPPFVLQTGVERGGSLLYFASLLDMMGAPDSALVIGVDIAPKPEAKTLRHPRIRILEGSSTDPAIIREIESLLPASQGLVSLDSDHSCGHVSRELELYHRFVAPGSYLVVEDTNVNGHPVHPGFGPGPYEAVQKFLKANKDFEADDALWKRNRFSFHQYGWLKRVR